MSFFFFFFFPNGVKISIGNIWQHQENAGMKNSNLKYNCLILILTNKVPFFLFLIQEQYFSLRPDLKTKSYGNISERVELRKRLGCQSFRWYLDHVYPEMQIPGPNARPQQPIFINRGPKRPRVLQRGRVRRPSLAGASLEV